MRRLLAIVALLLVLALFVRYCVRVIPADAPHPPAQTAPVQAARGLIVPVAGVKPGELVDTFAQARAAGTSHDAIDIMAPRGAEVRAAAPGRIEKLFHSEKGGNTIYVRSPDRRWIYYYAHLDAYRAGLHEGQTVAQGEAIATVGSTGNADPAAPHLHFAINRMAPGEDWYEGTPINPYPLLTDASVGVDRVTAPRSQAP
ncbi:MAG TPA: M23 family metallopeptidase [Sphingomonadaceae bacterium]|nr:M23 family metallopeptidase [Sphingomonadaceae bacterium]